LPEKNTNKCKKTQAKQWYDLRTRKKLLVFFPAFFIVFDRNGIKNASTYKGCQQNDKSAVEVDNAIIPGFQLVRQQRNSQKRQRRIKEIRNEIDINMPENFH
jgi:hypothetical protein